MAHGSKKHSRIHLEVAGDRSGNDRHLTYQQEVANRIAGKHSHANDASENGKDSTIHSEALNGNGRNTQRESHVDRYDAENGKSKNSKGRFEDVVISPVDTRFGSAEIYDALYPTEKLETSSSSSSSSLSSSSEDLFQVDTKKCLKSKESSTSMPKSTEVTRQTANHDDLDKESDEHPKLSSLTSFEFRHGSSMLPTESPPIQTMNRSREPNRNESPPSIFNRSHSILDWSVASNDSLFSINVGNHSFNRDDDLTMRRSEDITKPAELIAYVPSPLNDKKENHERAKVDLKNEKTSTEEVESDIKAAAAASNITWNSSNDSDENGGNAESFAFAVNKKPTSCFYCGWGFCYCSCFSCFTCCTSCSWPSGYCCKVSCSCCKIWSCNCQRWCCCFPKCLTKGDDKSVFLPDAEKEQVKANPAEETKNSSSESWFSCFSCAPILSCLSCSPCRSFLSCSPCRSCLSCLPCRSCLSFFSCSSSKSCFSCFSCSFLRSCFSCSLVLPSCKCFSCSGGHFPSCQGCCTLLSCRCFSCSGCCALLSCRCFSGLCHFSSCNCFSCRGWFC